MDESASSDLSTPPAVFDPSWILFHGSGVLAVNKPGGIPVHRGTKHPQGLAEIIDAWVSENPGVLEIRPGSPVYPVHRLDLEATGVLLFGLTRKVARILQSAFRERLVEKRYLAVVAGPVEAVGHLRGKIGVWIRGELKRSEAEIEYRRMQGDDRLSLVEVRPVGGRTHQIRELFAKASRPLAGDLRYGRPKPARQFLEKFGVPHLLLHAHTLTFPEEVPGMPRTIEAPPPPELLKVLAQKGWKL